jgi:hypothetical protein
MKNKHKTRYTKYSFMETTTQTQSQENVPVTQGDTLSGTPSQHPHHLKNVYPTMRHIILVVSILLALTVLMFLIHQNGKSIYEHGV